jgi:hypothetical protein
MVYQQKIWEDKRSPWKIFCDRMYRHYLDEKEVYNETDILEKKEYLSKYDTFLQNKWSKLK